MKVSIVKQTGEASSLKTAIELCDGFKNLKPDYRILVKPNLCTGSNQKNTPPFGVNTTALIILINLFHKEYQSLIRRIRVE